MKNRVFLIPALILCAFSSCGKGSSAPASSAASSAAKDTLNIGLYSEIISMDSAFAYDFSSNPVVIQVTEGLLYYGKGEALQGGLCESWEEVDPLTYVYRVRSNVTFSDGSPMTMEDVLFSVRRYADPALASYLAWMYDNVASVEQTGDWEFTVTLKQPDTLWKHTFATTAGHVHNKAFVENAGDRYGSPAVGVLGTGPYTFTRWDVGSQVVLDYNENYWNRALEGEPAIKRVVFQFIPEDTTRVMACTSGQVDFTNVTPVELLTDVENSAAVHLVRIPTGGLHYMAFNCKKPPFDDVNVRRAISYSIDSGSLQNNIVKDAGSLTNYIAVPESLFLFERDAWLDYQANCRRYDYDLEAAKAALAASAYPGGFTCTISVDEKSLSNSVALVLQQALAPLGINASIERLSNDEIVSLQFGAGIDDRGVRPYDIGLFEWYSDFPDPSGVLVPLHISTNAGDGGSNSGAYSNAEVDSLLLRQAASADTKERTALMFAALDIISAEAPYYIWTHPNWLFTVSNRITAGVDTLTDTWIWNMYVKNITF
ncbi:MAG: ABC transporter substrate-binding protein [Spirochaetaceae bacterium]|jgi:peptide/nickel transport system substrate-binding protein|nr:ABC transporter substrate-binding protein [Spirochaetaceae bacterium]